MREKVALAIGRVCWGGEVEPKGNWLKAADAAIAALREPTAQMLGAGYDAQDDPGGFELDKAWRGAIDEALK